MYSNILSQLEKITVHRKRLKIYLENNFNDLYQEILDATHFLSKTSPFSERMFCIENNISEIPKCQKSGCNNHVKFRVDIRNYRMFCSVKCQTNDENIIKAKNAKIRKNLKNVVEKRRKTVKIKIKENPNYYKEISEKCKQTKKERYGDENYNNMDSQRETNLRIRGVEYSMQDPKVIEKSQKTVMKKHSVKNNFNIPKNIIKRLKPFKMSSWPKIVNNTFSKPLFSKEDYIELLPRNSVKFVCKKCNDIFESIYNNGLDVKCPKCYPIKDNRSKKQSEII